MASAGSREARGGAVCTPPRRPCRRRGPVCSAAAAAARRWAPTLVHRGRTPSRARRTRRSAASATWRAACWTPMVRGAGPQRRMATASVVRPRTTPSTEKPRMRPPAHPPPFAPRAPCQARCCAHTAPAPAPAATPMQASSTGRATCWLTQASARASRSSQSGQPSPRCVPASTPGPPGQTACAQAWVCQCAGGGHGWRRPGAACPCPCPCPRVTRRRVTRPAPRSEPGPDSPFEGPGMKRWRQRGAAGKHAFGAGGTMPSGRSARRNMPRLAACRGLGRGVGRAEEGGRTARPQAAPCLLAKPLPSRGAGRSHVEGGTQVLTPPPTPWRVGRCLCAASSSAAATCSWRCTTAARWPSSSSRWRRTARRRTSDCARHGRGACAGAVAKHGRTLLAARVAGKSAEVSSAGVARARALSVTRQCKFVCAGEPRARGAGKAGWRPSTAGG